MVYFDLEKELRHNVQFKAQLRKIAKELEEVADLAKSSSHYAAKEADKLKELYRACRYNPLLLVHHYFPKYPRDKPLSFADYPFVWALLNFMKGGFTVIRGSRQIAKSTAFAVRQVLNAYNIDGFSSLYLCPRSQQLKTYATRLRDVERSHIYYTGTGQHEFRKNLDLKEFPNRSKIELAYVLQDPAVIRGKSADEMLVDECLTLNTSIDIAGGSKKILAVRCGDVILAFDEHNRIVTDRVKRVVLKGKRPAWRIQLTDGRYLECTSNERFRTNYGWLYLSQLLSEQEAQRCPKAVAAQALVRKRLADGAGHPVGGRGNAVEQYQTSPVLHHARSYPGGLLPQQSGSVAGLRQRSAQDCSQQGLGQVELCLFNGDYSSVRLYTRAVLPAGSGATGVFYQSGDSRMGHATDLGGDCLVVSGRRQPVPQRELHDNYDQHAQFSSGAGGYACLPACIQGGASQGPAGDQALGEAVLGSLVVDQSHAGLCRERAALCASQHALQAGHLPGTAHLQVLRGAHHGAHRQPQLGGPLLQEAGVQAEARPGTGAEVGAGHGPCCGQRAKGCRAAEAPGGRPLPAGGHQRQAAGALCRPGLPGEVECLETGVAAPAQGAGAAPNVVGAMVPVAIQAITYLGEEEVCDLETERHHTFFANGLAVHNCQDFDADLETEVLQIQSASPYKIKIFAGTSLTTETFLEGKFQQSSQGYWSIKCSHCNHWNIPLIEYNVMDMIQKQGPSCTKCSRLLNVYQGEFIHGDRKMLEERQWGFHVPQIVLPSVVKDSLRWEEIYKAKISGANKNKFLQELLGIAIEEGARELTRQHLMDICVLGDYRPMQQRAKNRGYDYVVSGCDWGGSDYNAGAKLKVSTTVHVMMGIDAYGKFDILHMRRYMGMDYDDISDHIVEDHMRLGGNAIGTDFGVGAVYNNRIRKRINPDRHMIFMYVGPRCAYIDEPEENHLYNMWSLNKTESLTVLFDAIKAQRIRCFDWEIASEYLTDFLNMYRAPAELPGGATTFTYRASALKPNDTAQAVNYAFVVGKILLREPIFADNSLQRKLDHILRGGGGGATGFLPGRGGPRAISR